MNNGRQTSLFESDSAANTPKPKKYTVQKYKLSYVKENASLGNCRVTNKNDVMEFCTNILSSIPLENVCIIALDNGNRIIGYDCIEGTTNQCALYPANVFRFLLSSAASSFIVAHNHPGGNTNPSQADWAITERLKSAGALLDVPLMDHLIITENKCVSLRELPKWN
jgi:DNA repair protein RadC